MKWIICLNNFVDLKCHHMLIALNTISNRFCITSRNFITWKVSLSIFILLRLAEFSTLAVWRKKRMRRARVWKYTQRANRISSVISKPNFSLKTWLYQDLRPKRRQIWHFNTNQEFCHVFGLPSRILVLVRSSYNFRQSAVK